MKRIIVFFAVCAMALCAASCNKKQEPTEFYEWEPKCLKEDYTTDETQYNDVKAWMDATFEQISPLTRGSGNLSKGQLESTISNAENAMAKVVTDFEEARKTHDFGPYYYSAPYYYKSIRFFHVLDRPGKEIYKGQEYTIDYQALPRFLCDEDVNEESFSKKISFVPELDLAPSFSYKLLHLDPEAEIKIAGEPRVFDINTHDSYTGTPFVLQDVVVGENGLGIAMKFFRDHTQEYLGSWYILIPVEQKGSPIDKCEVMIKVTLK